MARFLAGVATCFFLLTGAFFLFSSKAKEPALPPAPVDAGTPSVPLSLSRIPDAPVADPKSKEEKRFARADKNDDGKITLSELVEPRRKAFGKLDLDHDGRLSFEEWAVKSITKFETADSDKSEALTPAEYATTAPRPKNSRPACRCG